MYYSVLKYLRVSLRLVISFSEVFRYALNKRSNENLKATCYIRYNYHLKKTQ